jgi:iron complex outermembrane receptor protein
VPFVEGGVKFLPKWFVTARPRRRRGVKAFDFRRRNHSIPGVLDMMKFNGKGVPFGARRALAVAVLAASLPAAALAEEAQVEEIVVEGSLRSLPGENVESVFGFSKSLLELPRSASTISSEQIERFGINDIDDMVALAPGSFTQSFFGVAGSLDVRGTPGETYFRGMRRLDNPGNYPTPIAASDRIDVVRGPASPIFGPSKIGGYLNFEPKSARADSGQYMNDAEGMVTFNRGSWNNNVITAEVGGPGKIAGKDYGYYLFGSVEDSDSFYENTDTDQTVLQASFDMDVNDRLRIQTGAMYHEYVGNQVAGWNRLTQELVDNGTYITGSPAPLDTNGDGVISHQEYNAAGNGFEFAFGVVPETGQTLDDFGVNPIPLENVGTAQLDFDQVLVAEEDTLEAEVLTLYFDAFYLLDNGIEIKNQLFYEQYDNLSENVYGFSQAQNTWVIEEKLVIAGQIDQGSLVTQWQLSPSVRFTDFERGDDYINEYFDRRDLTGPSTALDKRLLATQIDDDYTEYYIGEYTDIGLAALVDLTHENGLSGTFGLRWDTIEMESRTPVEKLLFPTNSLSGKDTRNGISWSASISWGSPIGLRPYFTASEQSTVIAGQGAEITVDNILEGGAFDVSELMEGGVKGSFLDDTLYFAVSMYRQERTDFSAQSITTNQATETEGTEVEVRWAVNDALLLTAGYSKIEVTNLTTESDGGRFSFIGNDDLDVAPGAFFGSALGGQVFLNGRDARRAGIPENIYSATATYDFFNGLTVNGSVVRADAVDSGFSRSVRLPSYTLVNIGASYEIGNWNFAGMINNVTDEEYFRANFPNLFGSVVVLPELPRNFSLRAAYRF